MKCKMKKEKSKEKRKREKTIERNIYAVVVTI
jgi:hypothetical protein